MRAVNASGDSKGTIQRVVDLLRCFAEASHEQSLTEIADRVALPRSTTHRLLQLLRTEGFVQTDGPYQRYNAGPELFRVAALLSARMPIVRIATPVMRRIVDTCDETCLLGIFNREHLTMTFAAKVESTKPIRYAIELNIPRTLVWGSTGRAILAFLDDDEIDRAVAANQEPSATGSRMVDRAQLRAEIDGIRRDGFAVTQGQRIANSVGVAAPFFFADGTVGGDLALTIPQYRYDARQRARLVDLISQGAARLSAALGYGTAQHITKTAKTSVR